MPDVAGLAAASAEPRLLERQLAERVIDVALHLLDSPRGPSPELRQAVVDDGNALLLRLPRDVPVEARIVDQHDCVRPRLGPRPLDLLQQAKELRQLR